MAGYDGRGAKFPLTIVRGADMAFTVTATTSAGAAIDLSAATIAGEVYNTAGTLVDTFNSTVTGSPTANVITLSFTDTETALLTSEGYTWTLWVTRGGDKRPWLAGPVRVTTSTNGGPGSSGTALTATVDSNVAVAVSVAAVGGTGGSTDAADITIVDVAGYYTATNVEAALAEVKLVADTAAGGGITLEQVQDDLGNTSLVAGTGITKTYDDNAGTITVAVTSGTYQPLATVLTNTTASYTTAEASKLAGIEAGADVTDTANVTAAGALMDSEVDADLKTFALPANTTISVYGASLVDDADQATAQATLGLTPGTNVQAYDADLADIAAIADQQGDIIVRGASGWERLAKSATSTHVLTAGASQPAWAAPSGGGSSDPLAADFIVSGRIFAR